MVFKISPKSEFHVSKRMAYSKANREMNCEFPLENWITIYNEEKPHISLGRISPRDYRVQAENNALGMSA